MSQSHKPTRALVCASASARFAATVDLPTPPLPLATAMACLIPGIRVAPTPAAAPAGGAWMSIKTFAPRTPSIARRTFSASFLIVAGTFGSLVASASCTFISPLSMLIDLTKPKETMSRLKPGYLTDFSASRICSSETSIATQFTRGVSGVKHAKVRYECELDLQVPRDRMTACKHNFLFESFSLELCLPYWVHAQPMRLPVQGPSSGRGQTRLAQSGRSRLTTPSRSSILNATFGAILRWLGTLSQSRKRVARPRKAATALVSTSLATPAQTPSRSHWSRIAARSG